MRDNDQFFLNVAMAMGKSILDPVQGVWPSSLVTAMARNGTDFGVSSPSGVVRRHGLPHHPGDGMFPTAGRL